MPRKLLIGGKKKAKGWEILNAMAGPHVDHLGNANDLSRFEDGTFQEIYASHILEHLDYKDELLESLQGWFRVLAPGGKLYISVPDLGVLSRLIADGESLPLDEHFLLMRMLFGGHQNEWDYHVVGLNARFLENFLTRAGFETPYRVKRFGMFDDTSELLFKGTLISLNMIAEKPREKPQAAPSALLRYKPGGQP